MDDGDFIFSKIVNLAEVGYWVIDLKTGSVNASKYFWNILGYEKGELEETLDNLKKIHWPEDWDSGWVLISKLLKNEIDIYENKIRYLTKDNQWLLCEVKGVVTKRDQKGEALEFIGFIRDLSYKDKFEELQSKQKQNQHDLEDAQNKINELAGVIPICSKCKKIRNDKGYWKSLEAYIEKHSNAIFSHGLCEECSYALYKDKGWFAKYKEELKNKDRSSKDDI